MRSAHDARGAIHGSSEKVIVPAFGAAEVDSAADGYRKTSSRFRSKRDLKGYRRADRICRIVENGIHAIAGGLDDAASACVNGRPTERIVGGQRTTHRSFVLMPKSGAAFDVCEKDRNFHREEWRGADDAGVALVPATNASVNGKGP